MPVDPVPQVPDAPLPDALSPEPDPVAISVALEMEVDTASASAPVDMLKTVLVPAAESLADPLASDSGASDSGASDFGASGLGVGSSLRAAREQMGKTLSECSKQLRIRQPFLKALEDGRHGDLPGGTYAAGFLRTYAEFLSLDGEEMVRRFRQEGAGGFAARAELSFPSPVTEGRIPGGAVIFLGIILAAVAYGGWYMLSVNSNKVAEIVPPLPDRLSSMLTRPAALTGDSRDGVKATEDQVKVKEDVVPPQEVEEEKPNPPSGMVTGPAPIEAASIAPEPVKVAPPKVEVPKVEAPKVEAPKVEAPKVEALVTTGVDGKVYGAEIADARVVLKATGDDCWIQVREMDGSLLMSRLLRRGDSYRVPNRPGLNLMVGNAGSLEVSIDGKKGPALGATGQVRRDIRLDPDKLSSGG